MDVGQIRGTALGFLAHVAGAVKNTCGGNAGMNRNQACYGNIGV